MLRSFGHADWSSPDISAKNAHVYAARAKALGAQLVFMMGVIEPTHWAVDPTKFPNGVRGTTDYLRAQGL